jgi:phosphoenolpyruvate phosphomutase
LKAVVLAAGVGRRLGAVGARTPKCLLRIGPDEAILDRQLRALQAHGVTDVVVAAGHCADRVIRHVAAYRDLNGMVVVEPDHATTNYIRTLHRCRHLLDDDVLLLHGDLVFAPGLLASLLAEPRSAAPVSRNRVAGSKDFVARVEGQRVREIRVGRALPGPHHPVAPLYRLRADDLASWLDAIDGFVTAGRVRCYAEEALNPLLATLHLVPRWTDGEPWMEVDTIQDLRRARRLFEVPGATLSR